MGNGALRSLSAALITISGSAVDGTLVWASDSFTAVSSDSPDSPGALEQIIVTAERREADLQQVPVSLYAFNRDSLQQTNVESVLDFGKLVPSALIQQNQGAVTTFLRGVGNEIITVANEPANALYIDDVYYSRLTASILRLSDVDRVEVLEGPQGTLFGRNATGGLIRIMTRTPQPGANPSLETSVGYGSFRTISANVYAASGFGPEVAGQLSVGYYYNPGFGRDVFDGAEANYERTSSLRTKWVIAPAEETNITLTGEYLRSNSDIGMPGQYPGGPVAGLGNTGLPITGGQLGPIGFYDRNQNDSSFLQSESYGGSVRVDHAFSTIRMIEIAAYHDEKEIFSSDPDYTPQSFKTAHLPAYTSLFTNELQAQSLPGARVSWTSGLFYMHAAQGYTDADLGGLGYVGAPPPKTLEFFSAEPTTSYAAYGQATFPMGGPLRLTVGGRYSNDLVHGNGGINLLAAPGAAAIPVMPDQFVSHRNQQFSWRGAWDYRATRSLMTYLSVSRAYKAGVYNLLTFSPTFVRPEILTAYEIGGKSVWLDSRLRINGDFFFYDIRDIQAEIVEGGLPALVNAQGEHVKGAELTAEGVVTGRLHAHAGVSYLDAKYTNFTDAPFYSAAPGPYYGLTNPVAGDAHGNRPSRAPVFSETVGGSYGVSTRRGAWTFAANYAHTGAFFWTPDNRVAQRAYGLVDAQAAYAIGTTGMTVKIWGSNLTNAKYVTEEYESAGAQGDISAAGLPRQYGVTFSYKSP